MDMSNQTGNAAGLGVCYFTLVCELYFHFWPVNTTGNKLLAEDTPYVPESLLGHPYLKTSSNIMTKTEGTQVKVTMQHCVIIV